MTMAQEGPFTVVTGSRPWHRACDAGFVGMPNAGVTGSSRLTPRFQMKVWEARQCVAGSGSLQGSSESTIPGSLKVKQKMQW